MQKKIPLIDIGLNLASAKFARDWAQVIERANAVGVEKFILTGTSVQTSKDVAALTTKMASGSAYFTAGVHPHYAKNVDAAALHELRRLLTHKNAVAVGETGLDYDRDFSPRDVQRSAFKAQVEIACELQMPLFLHEREAAPDLLLILDEFAGSLPRCVVHCFTGSAEVAQKYVDRGFFFGITGWVGQSHRNAALLQALQVIPRERLMIETDAPYLTPPGYIPVARGRNEPASLVIVAELLAAALGVTFDEVVSLTHAATDEFFSLTHRVANVTNSYD